MPLKSKNDCLLFIARTVAAARYAARNGIEDRSAENGNALDRRYTPLLSEHGVALQIADTLEGVLATVLWPDKQETPLPINEPRFWADQLLPENWERSPLKSDLERAVASLSRPSSSAV